MNQIIPFHYLISMSLDDGFTSVQKASKKRKEKKNYDGKKNSSRQHAYSLSPYFLLFISFVLFLTLRVLECGWIFRRSAIQDQGDFIPPFHVWVGPWLFW